MARSKWQDWETDDGLLLIKGWARDGLIDEQIAKNMGIAYSTFRVWKDKYPALAAVLKNTKEAADREIENALFEKAKSGDTTAMIFWLKNRKPEVWRDRKETALSGSVQTVPDRLVIDYGEEDQDTSGVQDTVEAGEKI